MACATSIANPPVAGRDFCHSIQNQLCLIWIVDEIHHATAVFEVVKIDRRSAVTWIHAHRRCIDDYLTVKVAVDVLVIIFAFAR